MPTWIEEPGKEEELYPCIESISEAYRHNSIQVQKSIIKLIEKRIRIKMPRQQININDRILNYNYYIQKTIKFEDIIIEDQSKNDRISRFLKLLSYWKKTVITPWYRISTSARKNGIHVIVNNILALNGKVVYQVGEGGEVRQEVVHKKIQYNFLSYEGQLKDSFNQIYNAIDFYIDSENYRKFDEISLK